RYAAIAEEDEKNRRKGEALFPEHKSLPFLMEHRAVMTQGGWESEYQQNPIIVGGGMFPIEKFKIVPTFNGEVRCSVRYWDKAGTTDGGAFTVGVLMHSMKDGQFVVADVRRGRWSALEREKIIKSTAEMDKQAFPYHYVWVEQEPGSSGKESGEATIRMLAGWKVSADRVTGCRPGTCFCSLESGTKRSWTSTRPFRRESSRIRSTLLPARSTSSPASTGTTARWHGCHDIRYQHGSALAR